MTSMNCYYTAGPKSKTCISIWSVDLPIGSVMTKTEIKDK